MTENEAHETLEDLQRILTQYRHISKELTEANGIAILALEEIQKYKALGTVEELRIAKEKQIPKKPIMKPYFEDMDEEYLCCPTCGEILTDRIPFENKDFYFHCMKCGQAFDWSDEE